MKHPAPLKYLYPGWFAIVMGLSGLALAWQRATPLMGEAAQAAAWAFSGAAALVFVLLALASALRAQRHPEAWAQDRQHPVRHTFIATLPVGLLLLATVAVALLGPSRPAAALWWLGSVLQLGVTVWVMSRWWRGPHAGGAQWAGVTPALFIPIVGNVLAPLAGVPLAYPEWAAAQFGLGLLFWPVVLALLMVRLAVHGALPERLLPSVFIVIAPPAVSGLALLQLGAPSAVAWALWGMALFGLLWAGTQLRRILAMPMGLAHWAMSFPLAALAALTLRLASPSGVLAVLGPLLLALASLTVLWLLLMTLRGLRDGSLLAPEPVAHITPASADVVATPGAAQ
jgi:tellurite resistance protein